MDEPSTSSSYFTSSPKRRNKPATFVPANQNADMIINAYNSIMEKSPRISYRAIYTRLSKQLGIERKIIINTIRGYRKTKNISLPKNTKTLQQDVMTNIQSFHIKAIRDKIFEFWFNCQLPTLDEILKAVNEDISLPKFSRVNFCKLLKFMHFEYVKRGNRNALITKLDIVSCRNTYMEKIQKYREECRPIYYVGETWMKVKDKFSNDFSTVENETNLIVIHIGSKDGFVPEGLLCFEPKRNTQNYYDEIDGNTFCDWLKDVLPKLKDKAVIVLDNAPHHIVKMEKTDNLPRDDWSREDILKWLESKGIVLTRPMLWIDVLNVAKSVIPNYDRFIIDKIIESHGKVVLRLPTQHSDLNPAESVLAAVEDHIKFNNKTCTLYEMKELLVEGTETIDADLWKDFINDVVIVEMKYKELDLIVDDMMDGKLDIHEINEDDEN